MLWRLAVAAVSLTGFLGGAAVLATQFERDVASDFGGFGGLPSLDTGGPPPGVAPFRFDGLTLPKNLPFTLPDGAIVNPDGSITLPDGTKLPIDGSTLKDIAINLPTDGALKLPDDASFDGSKITCPSGCTLNIPGVGDYTLPPGTDLDLPADLAEQLRGAGYSGSNLPDAIRIPQGSDLTIPELKVPEGSITSDGTTRLVPPGGHDFGLPTGALSNPTNFNLPAGTEIDQSNPLALLAGIGYLAATSAGYKPTDLPPPLEDAADDAATPVDTFVQAEGAVRKGQPFMASGYVRTLAGAGLAGVPVTIYVNQSATTPGTSIGNAVTGADGTFRVQLTMPAHLPAGEYILMANSQPTRIGGTFYAGGWG